MSADIVATLKTQHQGLRSILEAIGKASSEEDRDAAHLHTMLTEYNELLTAHLHLEDKVFYPEVLHWLETRHLSTDAIQKLMGEMNKIIQDIRAFLAEFSTEEAIRQAPDFGAKFSVMRDQLEVRMYVEEEGVYLYLSE